jgi:hypothetical protein
VEMETDLALMDPGPFAQPPCLDRPCQLADCGYHFRRPGHRLNGRVQWLHGSDQPACAVPVAVYYRWSNPSKVGSSWRAILSSRVLR